MKKTAANYNKKYMPNISSIQNQILKTSVESAKACFKWIGKGNEKLADQAAVTAMRAFLNEMEIDGVVAIGEGERDDAPMLFIGERVGKGGIEVDIALDPLEGTTLCAHDAPNSISVLAVANRGGFLHAPDCYMKKIAVSRFDHPVEIDLDSAPKYNLKQLAKAKKCAITDLVVCILNRSRHEELIAYTREAGAKIKLIKDGDVMAAIAVQLNTSDIDMYMGIGGAPEGVLAAAALKCLGGQIYGQLMLSNDIEIIRAKKMGIDDVSRIYSQDDMVKGDVIFAATGVTSGEYLDGLKKNELGKFSSHSLLISSYNEASVYQHTLEY